MNTFATAALFAAVSLSAAHPAAATPAAPLTALVAQAPVEKAAFVFGEPLVPGRPSRLDRVDADAAEAAVESYFDFDALITFGALALGIGAVASMAFAGSRGKPSSPPDTPEEVEPEWRESVFQTLQADLWKFTDGYRRAA